jgi:hypothetical protein
MIDQYLRNTHWLEHTRQIKCHPLLHFFQSKPFAKRADSYCYFNTNVLIHWGALLFMFLNVNSNRFSFILAKALFLQIGRCADEYPGKI